MQLREFVGFHSGINNLAFVLLYESTLLCKWLQTFRQIVRVSLSKGRRFEDYSVLCKYNKYFSSISARNHYTKTGVTKHTVRCIEDEMG